MRGFTLIELLMAVAIVGILATIGVQSYVGYIEVARLKTATDGLRAIYLQQETFFSDNNIFYDPTGICATAVAANGSLSDHTAAINTNLFRGIQVVDNSNYAFCITQTTTSFTATATQLGITPVTDARELTITNLNVTTGF